MGYGLFLLGGAAPLLALAGVVRRQPSWLIGSALLFLPGALYLFLYQNFLSYLAGILLVLLPLGAAWALWRERTVLSWGLLFPLVIPLGWFLGNTLF